MCRISARWLLSQTVAALLAAFPVAAQAHGGGGVGGGWRPAVVIGPVGRRIAPTARPPRFSGNAPCLSGRVVAGCVTSGLPYGSSVVPPLIPPVIPPLGATAFTSGVSRPEPGSYELWRFGSGVWHEAHASQAPEIWERGEGGIWRLETAG